MAREEYRNPPVDIEAIKKTIYGHAHREPRESQMAVAFVVVNRAKSNKSYWGGTSINDVCRKEGQFWIGIFGEPQIDDTNMYNSIDEWLPGVLNGTTPDLTNGADHFLPQGDTNHDWLSSVRLVASYGVLNFYKSNWL